ncbi:unnamed protein product [Clonostachys rosea]|uniref:Cytochrome P450 n=1 Tax=Bionectria ochroleuca TaxID=29856 RepID=A0ABY6V2R2_BIOOC|nr:unnamed protein product [Clonostachys rosea]
MGWQSTVGGVFLGLGGLWISYCLLSLVSNYKKARTMGLPIRIIPISHTNPFWTLVDRHVLAIIKQLPFGLGDNNFTRYNFRGWELDDGCRSHDEMGDAFVMVTPGRNWLYIANPEALTEVFRRRADFHRCVELTEILDVFGPSIATAKGQRWRMQRKITASCFNEPTNEIVWREALWLAKDMLHYWSTKSSLTSAADDCRTLSLHVLSRASFGKSFQFEGHEERGTSGVSASYKNSLQTILENCVVIMALGTKTIAKPWMPKSIQKIHKAWVTFRKYMTDLYEEEKKAFSEGHTGGGNLMKSLVRASYEETKTGTGLTEAEIYGNIFAFNFAGHDTTAHSFTFAIYFLAANPDVQTWIREEIREVLSENDEEWSYTRDFPRLKRCLAVLMETIRLYTPVPVAKWTDQQAQTLEIGDKVVHIPPETMIIPAYVALHTRPEDWGSDPVDWRPSRWVTSTSIPTTPGKEELITPRRGTFLGWSDGARDCVGRKFSQVEFVATLARLFRDWRVDPVPQGEENMDNARERVKKLIKTDSGIVLLLQMLHPERAPLRWTKTTDNAANV